MAISITDEEWDALAPENFDTTALLRTVDAIDKMRNHLNDSKNGELPELRTDLLRLHQLAMGVFNQGAHAARSPNCSNPPLTWTTRFMI